MNNKSKGIIWNTLGSLMFALNSMLLVLIVSRLQPIEIAGEFGITFTTAQILYIVGLFGINIYQMTDYQCKYRLKAYFGAKYISTLLMFVLCGVIVIFTTHDFNKRLFTVFLSIYMAIYSYAEVYQSFYFQNNRLDLSGKSLFYRTLISVIVFYICLKFTLNIILAIITLIISNLITFYFVTYLPVKKIKVEIQKTTIKEIQQLMLENIPVFLSLFTMNLLTNISKYTIDFLYGSEIQGYYNVIFMPVMVINLLASFIFKPMLNDYATLLKEKSYKEFKKLLLTHIEYISIFLCVALLGTYLLGTQVLSWIYKIDITPYLGELMLIVISGGFVAMASLLYFILIIMRKQKAILMNYILCVVVETVLAALIVPIYGILGGTLSLVGAQVLLVINFIVMLFRYIGADSKCQR